MSVFPTKILLPTDGSDEAATSFRRIPPRDPLTEPLRSPNLISLTAIGPMRDSGLFSHAWGTRRRRKAVSAAWTR